MLLVHCEILLLKPPAKFQTCARVRRDFLKLGTSLPFLDFCTNPLQIKFDMLQKRKLLKRFKNVFNYINSIKMFLLPSFVLVRCLRIKRNKSMYQSPCYMTCIWVLSLKYQERN